MVYEEHIENLREVIEGLIEADDLSGALALFSNRHPADQADLLEEFEEQAQSRLLFALPGSQLAELLEYLDEDRRGAGGVHAGGRRDGRQCGDPDNHAGSALDRAG